MKKAITILAVLVLVCGTAVVFAKTASEAPDSITLDACKAKKSAVTFNHKDHGARMDCVTCHHTQEDLVAGSSIEVETCVTCHQNPTEATTPDCAQMSTKKNPYHINCITCHKTEKKAGNKVAPTKCAECHPKAKKPAA